MAKGPQYNLAFRRRREGRTRYRKRRRLVVSGIPRVVIRPSNKHLAVQIVEAHHDGDRVLASAHSSELKDFGWRAPCGNMPAAYLTGLLAGHRAKARGLDKAILDLGLHSRVSGSRIFAATKGALDAGLSIPHDKKIIPAAERMQGKHVAEYSQKLSSNQELFKKMFSTYLKQKIKPDELSSVFNDVQGKIKAGAPSE